METLICPQCGAQLDETHVTGDVVRCSYCATQFRVPQPQPVFQPKTQPPPQQFVVNYAPAKPKGVGTVVAANAAREKANAAAAVANAARQPRNAAELANVMFGNAQRQQANTNAAKSSGH
ncbi:MAG TPA: hypothetical protein VGI80_06045 [Pyrinomonadaceae bacterium]|jgi:hypothetical protein